jgi:hypothetical protein
MASHDSEVRRKVFSPECLYNVASMPDDPTGTMSRKIRFTKRYMPIGFGDRPDPGTVEGHLNSMEEAAETRRYNKKRMKELETQDEAKRRGLLSRIMRLSSHQATEVAAGSFNRTAVPAP